MPATANEIARAEAQRFIREWKVYIGPLREQVAAGLLQAGQPVTLPTPTNTTATINVDDTTISCTSGSLASYPSAGMVAVSDATGTAWYSYTSRTSTQFQDIELIHGDTLQAAGADVTQWFDITERLTATPIVREYEASNKQVPIFEDFTIELSGRQYNRHVMLPDATVLVLERATPDGVFGTWTNWRVFAVGYADQWNTTGSVTPRYKETSWTIKAPSISTYIFGERVNNRQYGLVDLAPSASVTASSTLGNPLVETDEVAGGVGAISADNVIDGDPKTVWISSVAPNTPNESTTGTGLVIQEVMANPYPGAPASLQWILITDFGLSGSQTRYMGNYYITTNTTVYGAGSPPNFFDNFIRLPDITLNANNPSLILCQNLQVFQSFYGTESNIPAHDWRQLRGWNQSSTFPADTLTLDLNNEVIHLRLFQAHISPHIQDMLAWGTPANKFKTGDHTSQWTGGNLAAPTAGTSYRRSPFGEDTNTAADWVSETNPMPGDAIDDDNDEWLKLDLGVFTVRTAQSMASGSSPGPGETLTLTDVGPLWDAGELQIDSEILSYTEKDETTNTVTIGSRGTHGTTATSHSNNTLVYDYETSLGANRLYIVDEVDILRERVTTGAGVPIVPQDVALWISTLTTPKVPGDANYRVDWVGSDAVRKALKNRATFIPLPIPPQKARHLLIRVHRMSDGGRAKINEVRAYRYNGVMQNAVSQAKPILDILLQVLSRSAISVDASIADLPSDSLVSVREGDAQSALQDILTSLFLCIRFERDGTVLLKRSAIHPLGARPEIYATLDADTLRSPGGANVPSKYRGDQFIVQARNIVTGDVYEGTYPPGNVGRTQKLNMQAVVTSDNGAAMLARALYFNQDRITETVYGTTFGPAEWLTSGMRVLAEIQSMEGTPPTWNCRVTEVVHGGGDNVEQFTLQLWRLT